MNKIIELSIARKSVPIRFDVVQYATKPNIVFVLDDYELSLSAIASLYIEKQDGTKVYNNCTIVDNKIIYKPTTQSFTEVGTARCQLQIIDSRDTALSFLMYANITENIVDADAIESSDEFTALEEALQTVGDITALENRVSANEADIESIEQNYLEKTGGTITGDLTVEGKIAGAKVNKFGITDVDFGGSGTNRTQDVTIWGNTNNKVGVAVTNTQDNIQYGLHAKADSIDLYDYTNSETVWSQKTKILKKTVTGNTNSLGNINLALNPNTYHVLAVVPQNPYLAFVSGYVANNGTLQHWARICENNATLTPVANTAVSVDVWYKAN